MERRKFVIGLGAMATGSAAAMGTGAFSSVTANRGVTIEVADDSDAYLALTSDSEYTDKDGNQLVLDFSSSNETSEGGQGINQDATTTVMQAFTIENQGDQTVGLQIDKSAFDAARDEAIPDENGSSIGFFEGYHGGKTLHYGKDEMASTLDYETPENDDRVLGPGDSLTVGLYIYNDDIDWGTLDASITINALDEDSAANAAEN